MPPAPTTTDLATELRLVVGRLQRRLRQQSIGELTPSQLSALTSVEKHGPVLLGELARIEAVAPPTLTKIVGRLEELALVARQPNPADARSSHLTITASGTARLAQVRRERTAWLHERLAALTAEDRKALVAAVPVLARLLEDA
jgi:DNA-binding MarR family transcriptional regulator